MLKKRSVVLLALALALAAAGLLVPGRDKGNKGNQRFFQDQTYHHLTMRTLGQIPYGGAAGTPGAGTSAPSTRGSMRWAWPTKN